MNIVSSFDSNNFVNCGESMKEEYIKKEIKEEENAENLMFVHQETENSYVYEDIKKELKDEKNFDHLFPINYYTENGRKQKI